MLLDAGRDREDVGVEDDVLGRQVRLPDEKLVRALADRAAPLEGVRLAVLVERHDDHRRPVAAGAAGLIEELLRAVLEADRVDDPLALHALEPGLDYLPARRVDHHRHPRDVRLGPDQVEETDHACLGVEQALVHVHVDRLGAVLHLAPCDGERRLEVALPDEAREARRAGDVGALADVHEQRFRSDVEGLEAGKPGDAGAVRRHSGGDPRDRLRKGPDVVRSGAAAPPHDVDEPPPRPVADLPGELGRGEVVAAELVRKPGVRVRAHRDHGNSGELLDPRAQLDRPERAVEPDRERPRVLDRVPERFDRLPRQGAAGSVGDGARDDDREAPAQLFEHRFESVDRGLRVQSVEHRLDEEEVHATRNERVRCLFVGSPQLVEARVAGAGILHLGGDGCGAVGGSEHPGREAGAVRGGPCRRSRARDPGAGFVDLGRKVAGGVVSLRDRGGGERVGEHDVRPGLEVGVVDLRHHVGAGQTQQIVIAAKGTGAVAEALAAVVRLVESAILEHGPGGAVEQDDALAKKRLQETVHVALAWLEVGEAGRTAPGAGRTGHNIMIISYGEIRRPAVSEMRAKRANDSRGVALLRPAVERFGFIVPTTK